MVNELVESILDVCLSRVRERARNHQKEDHAHRKNIDVLAAVGTPLEDLRGLILTSADLRVVNAQPVVSLFPRRETEISYLKLVLLIEEEVFRLEIAMDNACSLMQVFNGT